MNLEVWRSKLNEIDAGLARLLQERLAISRAIGKYKADNDLAVSVPVREKEILLNLKTKVDSANFQPIQAIWQVLLRTSRAEQYGLKNNENLDKGRSKLTDFTVCPALAATAGEGDFASAYLVTGGIRLSDDYAEILLVSSIIIDLAGRISRWDIKENAQGFNLNFAFVCDARKCDLRKNVLLLFAEAEIESFELFRYN